MSYIRLWLSVSQTETHQNVIENLTIKIKFDQYCPRTTGDPPKNGRRFSSRLCKVNNKCVFRKCFEKWMFLKIWMHFILLNFEIAGFRIWSFSLNPFESRLDQMILFSLSFEATKYTSSQGQVKKSNFEIQPPMTVAIITSTSIRL